MFKFYFTLILSTLFLTFLGATNPTGDLRLEVISAYNFVVDSNSPESGPSSAYVGVEVCNDGANDLTDVVVNIGDFNAGTPGVYPSNTVSFGYSGTFSFEHSGNCDDTDAIRNIGTIAAGECVTQYWLLEYPVVDASGKSTIGANSLDDDLTLDFDYWATADDGGTPLAADDSWTVTLRSMISAMANKSAPNGTNKVPSEYLAAIEEELGWRPDIGSASAGSEFELQGVWYDLGNINKGYDNDGDFIPDYNIFMQPVGDPSKFDPCCYKLTKTYGLIIVKLTDGTEHLIPFEDQLYFSDIPDNNRGAVGLVFYEFLPVSAPCSSALTPYQCVASGRDNEKYNGDFGASFGAPSSSPPDIAFDKTGPVTSGTAPPATGLTYNLAVTNNDSEPAGIPAFSMPLVISDAIPAGTDYAVGTATYIGTPTATIEFSIDNGATWTTVEPSPANLVTNIRWWLNDVLASGATVTASFDVDLPSFTIPVIENEGGVGFGSDDPFITDDAATIVLGTNSIGDTVFEDDGGTTGTLGNGTQDGDEGGVAGIEIYLFLDANGDGILDGNDVALDTVTTDGSGNYSFDNLPDGDFLVIINDTDPDLPVGWGITTDGPQIAVTLAGGNDLDIDYGFVPAVQVTKTLTSTDPAYENQYVTYDINVSNLVGGSSGPTTINPYPSDIWSTTTGVYNSAAGGTNAVNGANSTGGPDNVVATLSNWPKGGYLISDLIGNDFSAIDFDAGCPFSVINSITGIIDFELSGDLTNDRIQIYYTVNNTLFVVEEPTIANLNANYSPASANYTFNIPLTNVTSLNDLQSLEIGIMVDGEGGGGSNWDGIDLNVDAIGISIDANTCVVTPPSCAAGNLTLDINFDGFSEEVSWNIKDLSSTIVASSGNTDPATLYALGLTSVSEPITLPDGEYTFTIDDSYGDGLSDPTNGDYTLTSSDGTVLASGGGNYLFSESTSICIGASSSPFSPTSLYPVPLKDSFNAAQMCFVESSITPDSINNTTGEIFWDNIGPINGGDNETVSITFEAKDPGTPGETLDNTASVTGATYANGNPANDDSDIASTTLMPTGSIGDQIINSNTGLGIEGVIVNLVATVELVLEGLVYPAGATISTTTDANGNYLFDGLHDGNYTVTVDPSSIPGTAIQSADPDGACPSIDCDNVTTVAISIENDHDTADFSYAVPNAITGNIWEDNSGEGTQDIGENGMAGITVYLSDGVCSPITSCPSTTTDAEGNYSFVDLTDGTYTVVVDNTTSPGAGWSNTTDPEGTGSPDNQSDPIVVSGGNIYSGNDFGYNETGASEIGDVLFVDWNSDGIQGPNTDEGISGVSINLYEDSNGDGIIDPAIDAIIATTTTGADGAYSFTNLPAGDFVVVIDAGTLPGGVASQTADPDESGAACTTCDGTSSVTGVDGTSAYNDEDFGYAPFGAGQIGDNVFVDANGDGIQDLTEAGLQNIDVILYADLDGDGNYSPIDTVTTDADGNYLFDNLPDGDYQVLIDPAETDVPLDPFGNDAITTSPATQDIVISGGAVTEINGTPCSDCDLDADFGYAYPAAIGNTIFYDNNANGTQDLSEGGIAGVTVYLCHVDSMTCNASTAIGIEVTDINGEYLFTGLNPGEYNVVVDVSTLPGGVVSSADPNSDGLACSDPDMLTFGYDPCDDMADSVAVNYGTQMMGIDFGYEPSSVVGDQVWFDVNGDGNFDNGEPVMSFVDVIITPSAGVDLGNGLGIPDTVTTDSEGLWSYANLPDGDYSIELDIATLPAGYSSGYDPDGGSDSSASFTVSGGSVTDAANTWCTDVAGCDLGLDFAVELAGSNDLSGSVCLDDGSDDGICSTGGESMLVGTTVYLYNAAGTFMGSTTVDANGNYLFTGLPDDTYNVVVGTTSTILGLTAPTTDASDTPASSVTNTGTSFYQTIPVSGGEVTGVDFAFQVNQDIDFGDLPGPYPTALTDGPVGAYHILDDPTSVYFGTNVDAETSPIRNLTASGDDADGVNDDDGIIFNNTASWTTGVDGGNIDLTIAGINTEGYVVAFIDFNEDGDFSDPGEMILDTLLANGTHASLDFDIPAGTDLTAGNTLYARFRVFEEAPSFSQFAYSGEATNGEVEDYRIVIDQITNTTLPVDDDNITMVNIPVAGDVTTNDTDPQGDGLVFSGFDNPADPGNYITSGTVSTIPGTDSDGNPIADAGDLSVNSDGTYNFIPATDFVGVIEIPYLMCDDASPEACENATLVITVNPIPDETDPTSNSIIANNDDNITYEDVNVNGNVLSNDADPDGDNLTFSGFEDPNNLGIYVNTGTLSDIGGLDENGLPIANAGDLIINTDGSYTFDPEPGFTGTLSISYQVCDDATPSNCTEAELLITVLPDANVIDNDPPFAGDDFSTTVEDTPVDGDWLSNDNDPNTNNLTVNGSAGNVDPAAPGDGTVTLATLATEEGGTVEIFNDGTYTYTPAPGFFGPDEVSYEVCDVTVVIPQPLCDSATIHLLVTPVNTIASTDDFNNTPYNTPVSADVSTNDVDAEGDNTTFALNNTNGGMDPADGTIIINPNGSYTFTPANGFSGETSFTYSVCDDGSPVRCDTAIVYLEVLGPISTETVQVIANPDANTILANQPGSGNVMSNDLDPDDLSPSLVGSLSGVPVAGIDADGNPVANAGSLTMDFYGNYTFVPAIDFIGTVTQEYIICDSNTPAIACDTSNLVIDVLPDLGNNNTFANDDAAITDAGIIVGGDLLANDFDNESADNQSIDSYRYDTDGDGDADATGTVGSPIPVGGVDENGNYFANAGELTLESNGTYTFQPAYGFSGNIVVPYTACDDNATQACADATLVITVLDVRRDYGDAPDEAPSIYPAVWHRAISDSNGDNELDGGTDVWLGMMTSFDTVQLGSSNADGDLYDDAIEFGTDYGDFPNAAAPTTEYDVIITVNSSVVDTVHYGMWIDWNTDGVYDDFYGGFQKTASPAQDTITIITPAVFSGVVNVRLRADDDPFSLLDFAGGRTNGEVEDFQSAVILPVELSQFEGKAIKCNETILSWTTNAEVNFSHYELERSPDGIRFEQIEKVEGRGDLRSKQVYHSMDFKALSENYYRLKMVDLDGSIKYSDVVYVETDCGNEHGVTVFPNPMIKENGVLNVQFYAEGRDKEVFEIIDVLGTIVSRIVVSVNEEWNTLQLDVSSLPSGRYYLRQRQGEGQGEGRNVAHFIIQE